MTPAEGQDITVPNAARTLGPTPGPLSLLAARTPEHRAENFPFTDEDAELLRRALAEPAA